MGRRRHQGSQGKLTGCMTGMHCILWINVPVTVLRQPHALKGSDVDNREWTLPVQLLSQKAAEAHGM